MLAPLAMSKGLHKSDRPTPEYLIKLLGVATNSNIIESSTDEENNNLKKFVNMIKRELKIVAPSNFLLSHSTLDTNRDKTIANYNDQFHGLQIPQSMEANLKDDYFAFLRVGGFNPLILKEMLQPLDNFPITDEILRTHPKFVEDSLEAARRENRLFIVDFSELNSVQQGATVTYIDKTTNNSVTAKKYFVVPIGLFAVPRVSGLGPEPLEAIAIQGGQNPDQCPIVTQLDGERWTRAKQEFNCADALYHELISHLGRTHLLVEPFVVVTNNMPTRHCIRQLLMPHIEGTAFINWSAIKSLVNPGGIVDRLFPGTLQSELELTAKSVLEPGFDKLMLPVFLEERGLLHDHLQYPFRDDGLRIWHAILEWVTDYVDINYKSDEEVIQDATLQRWATELVSEKGGRLRGFASASEGRLVSKSYLILALTMVIFTASAMHAAVNFPQKGIMSYAPCVPLSLYEHEPSTNFLPPLEMSAKQISMATLLGTIYYTKLGQYNDKAFRQLAREKQENVKEALQRFQHSLRICDIETRSRNRAALYPYTYLLPMLVPQSINI